MDERIRMALITNLSESYIQYTYIHVVVKILASVEYNMKKVTSIQRHNYIINIF